MVNVGYDGKLSEHLGVQNLGLRPLYKGVVWFLWSRSVEPRTDTVILSS
jgi:hypothetical protein